MFRRRCEAGRLGAFWTSIDAAALLDLAHERHQRLSQQLSQPATSKDRSTLPSHSYTGFHCAAFFFPKFPRNPLQAVSPLLPPAAGLLRACRAPPSPCLISSARAPDSSAETNLISGINKRVEMLIFAQKIRIFFFFWPRDSFKLLLNGRI